jgi:hypothetical protein
VAERDAFGREIGENSLADMGWVANLKHPPSAPPPPAPAPPAPETPQPTAVMPAPEFQAPPQPAVRPPSPGFQPPQYNAPRSGRTRRRRGRFPFKLVFLLIIIGCVWAFNVPQRIKDQVDKATDSIQHAVPTVPSVTPGKTERASLLSRSGLAAALRKDPAGRLVSLRVAADNVQTQVLLSGGEQALTVIEADGRVLGSRAPGGGSERTQPALRVDAAAPSRMIRGAHRKASDVDYLVTQRVEDDQVWILFLKNGTHYRGDAHGRHVERF